MTASAVHHRKDGTDEAVEILRGAGGIIDFDGPDFDFRFFGSGGLSEFSFGESFGVRIVFSGPVPLDFHGETFLVESVNATVRFVTPEPNLLGVLGAAAVVLAMSGRRRTATARR